MLVYHTKPKTNPKDEQNERRNTNSVNHSILPKDERASCAATFSFRSVLMQHSGHRTTEIPHRRQNTFYSSVLNDLYVARAKIAIVELIGATPRQTNLSTRIPSLPAKRQWFLFIQRSPAIWQVPEHEQNYSAVLLNRNCQQQQEKRLSLSSR